MFPRLKGKLVRNSIPQVTGDVRKRVLKAVNESVYECASIAYQLCPVDTGYLRESIAIESYNRGQLLRVVVEAEYAGYVEYGTRYMEAQPFLRPAVEAVRNRLGRRLGQITKGLGKEAIVGRGRRV